MCQVKLTLFQKNKRTTNANLVVSETFNMTFVFQTELYMFIEMHVIQMMVSFERQ